MASSSLRPVTGSPFRTWFCVCARARLVFFCCGWPETYGTATVRRMPSHAPIIPAKTACRLMASFHDPGKSPALLVIDSSLEDVSVSSRSVRAADWRLSSLGTRLYGHVNPPRVPKLRRESPACHIGNGSPMRPLHLGSTGASLADNGGGHLGAAVGQVKDQDGGGRGNDPVGLGLAELQTSGGERLSFERGQVQHLRGMLNINADNLALGIEVDHQPVLYLARIHTWARVEINVERVCLLIVMQFHSSPRLRIRRPKIPVRKCIVHGLAIRERYNAEDPATKLLHDAPKSYAAVRLNHFRQWFLENPLAPL